MIAAVIKKRTTTDHDLRIEEYNSHMENECLLECLVA